MKIELTHFIDKEKNIYGGVHFEVPDTSPQSFEIALEKCRQGLSVIFNEQDRKDGKQ